MRVVLLALAAIGLLTMASAPGFTGCRVKCTRNAD